MKKFVFVLLFAIMVVGVMIPTQANAFNKVWRLPGCFNVGAGESGFWDDSPGAGLYNESAYFWLVTNSSLNEYCWVGASGEGVSSTAYPELRVRASVNDGAILKVELKIGSEFCSGGTVISSVTISGTEDNSSFYTKTAVIPAGNFVGDVCVTLDDDPNNYNALRASALIDDIQIRNPATGAVGWRERFSRPY